MKFCTHPGCDEEGTIQYLVGKNAEIDYYCTEHTPPKWPDDFRGFGTNVRPKKAK